MLNRKYIISALLVLGIVLVIFLAVTQRSAHGDLGKWVNEKHGPTAARHIRNNTLDRFCLDCHGKKFGQTRENFCNECHKARNVELVP